jgi:hypothetical protein
VNRVRPSLSRTPLNRVGVAALLVLTFLITWTVHGLPSPPSADSPATTTPTPNTKDTAVNTTALPAIVATALDAANAHDADAWLAAFDPEGAVDDWGRSFAGHEAMRAWSDAEFIGVDVTLRVTDAHTTGDTTTVRAQVGGNGFNGPSHFTFNVRGDRIILMRITA